MLYLDSLISSKINEVQSRSIGSLCFDIRTSDVSLKIKTISQRLKPRSRSVWERLPRCWKEQCPDPKILKNWKTHRYISSKVSYEFTVQNEELRLKGFFNKLFLEVTSSLLKPLLDPNTFFLLFLFNRYSPKIFCLIPENEQHSRRLGLLQMDSSYKLFVLL